LSSSHGFQLASSFWTLEHIVAFIHPDTFPLPFCCMPVQAWAKCEDAPRHGNESETYQFQSDLPWFAWAYVLLEPHSTRQTSRSIVPMEHIWTTEPEALPNLPRSEHLHHGRLCPTGAWCIWVSLLDWGLQVIKLLKITYRDITLTKADEVYIRLIKLVVPLTKVLESCFNPMDQDDGPVQNLCHQVVPPIGSARTQGMGLRSPWMGDAQRRKASGHLQAPGGACN